jgi:hypothetical protein
MTDADFATLVADVTRIASAHAKDRNLRARIAEALLPVVRKIEAQAQQKNKPN